VQIWAAVLKLMRCLNSLGLLCADSCGGDEIKDIAKSVKGSCAQTGPAVLGWYRIILRLRFG